jgi:cytochrome c-type biogenesis protein CcmH/NrfG
VLASRAALREGDQVLARALVNSLIENGARNPEVQLLLSEVEEAAGRVELAERAAWMATQLAPTEARFLVRYGDLLARYHAGRFDAEAAAALEKALVLQPTSDEILLSLAKVEARSGQIGRAIERYRVFLVRAPPSPEREAVTRLLRDYERDLPQVTPLVARGQPPPGVPAEAWLALHVAYVYHQPVRDGQARGPGERHDDLEAALRYLEQAQGLAPGLVESYNLAGAIYLELGDVDRAATSYYASLEREPSQPNLLVAVAELEHRRGDPAASAALIDRAAEQGASDALYMLARRYFEDWDLWRSRQVLDRYFAAPASSLTRSEALALQASVNRRLVGGSVALFGACSLLIGWRLRRRRGRARIVSLNDLLDADPGVHRDVLRLVAAIRHEVIKHNTTGLEMLAEAIERGEQEGIAYLLSRLYGPSGALSEFDRYSAELLRLGDRSGLVLDLSKPGSCFGPLLEAIGELKALREALEGDPGPALADRLRAISAVINEDSYAALGAMLQELSAFVVGRDLLETVASEAYATGTSMGVRPEIPILGFEEGVAIRAFRDDIQLIMVNLCRNALRLADPAVPTPVGLKLEVELDIVTGVETVAFRVCDQVRQALTTEMIRSGYIERGLGLAVDAVERNNGSIAVEAEPGWEKAVVVRFPRVERLGREE